MGVLDTIRLILQDGLETGLIWSIMALGIFISFRILDFADLSAEGSIILGGAISMSLILKGYNPWIVVLVSFLGGFIVGAITGILHTKLKIVPILAGIISMTALYPINLRILGSASVTLGPSSQYSTVYTRLINLMATPAFAKIITTILIVVGLFFLLYWFFGTEIGISLRATGMNKEMSRAQGINTDIMVILGLALSNALIALSGSLLAQSRRSSNLEFGRGTIVVGLASIIIGEAIFGKRSFKIALISVIVGSIAFQIITATALGLGFPPNDFKLIQAILMVLILAFPLLKNLIEKHKKVGVDNVKD